MIFEAIASLAEEVSSSARYSPLLTSVSTYARAATRGSVASFSCARALGHHALQDQDERKRGD